MATGSEKLDQIVERLQGTADPKRRYEYVLWLAKKLQPFPEEYRNDAFKVKGCVSQVYVVGQLVDVNILRGFTNSLRGEAVHADA